MKFSVIYADPPWSFKTWSKKGMDRSPDYPVLNGNDIYALDIDSIANDNSVLFIWATSPMLKQALTTIGAWGFEYKTIAFTWIKTCKLQPDKLFTGLGYYTRANSEYCLLATRGKPLTRLDRGVHSVVMTPIGEHSEKPIDVFWRIDRLFGQLPSIELFSRKPITQFNWTHIGNEITGNDIRVDIERISKL